MAKPDHTEQFLEELRRNEVEFRKADEHRPELPKPEDIPEETVETNPKGLRKLIVAPDEPK